MALTFDPDFHTNTSNQLLFGVIIWANDPTIGRILFEISPRVMEDKLHALHAVDSGKILKFAAAKRDEITAACCRAFARNPSTRIELEPIDFNPTTTP
jgi:hypothetical protein